MRMSVPWGAIPQALAQPVDLGWVNGCAVMEAPRRPGAVYGEEYRAADAEAVVAAVGRGSAIPSPPVYA